MSVHCRGGRGSDHVPFELKWLSVGLRIILDLLSIVYKARCSLDSSGYSSNPCPSILHFSHIEPELSFCLKRTFLPSPTFPSNTNVGFPDWFPKTRYETMVKRMNEPRDKVWRKKLNATFHFSLFQSFIVQLHFIFKI